MQGSTIGLISPPKLAYLLVVHDPFAVHDPLAVPDPHTVPDTLAVLDPLAVHDPLMVPDPLNVPDPLTVSGLLSVPITVTSKNHSKNHINLLKNLSYIQAPNS